MQNEIKDDEQQKKKKRYIQLLSLLYMQIYEFNEMKNKSIKENFINKDNVKDKDNDVKDKDIYKKVKDNTKDKDDAKDEYKYLKCYLVNKDMIDNYKELYLYKTISKLIEFLKEKKKAIDFNYFNNNKNILENCFKNVGIDYSKLEPLEKKLIPTFFETEKLKIQGYYYPYNFFIIREEIFKYLFEKERYNQKNNLELSSFILYNMLIGKEGVFIWELNKENKQNKYISIYYLNDCFSEINKVYLFKDEEDFLKELNNNILDKKEIKEYYLFRNIKNNDVGLFNLIDDGKIIGKYINLFRSQYFEEKKVSGEFKKSLTIVVKKDEQKIQKINEFLKYLLINLTYIKDLKEYSINYIKNKENKESSLLGAYSSFAKSYNENNNSNLENQINNFINVFAEQSLGDSVKFNEENKNQAFEKLIENVIDSFKKESNPKKNKTDKTSKNDQNKIFDLFYGEQKDDNINQNNIKNEVNKEEVNKNGVDSVKIQKKVFNTLYLNPNDFTYDGKTSINLNMILDINYLKCKGIDIQKLPNILIIILENNNLIEVPSKLNIRYGYYNKEYKLLSSIRKYDNMYNYFSIVRIGNNLCKISYNSYKKIYENEIIYDKNEKNKSIIFFYEATMKEENYSSGNNEIFTIENRAFRSVSVQSRSNPSNNFFVNNGGYQDINNTRYLINNQFYNNTNVINNNNNIMINNYDSNYNSNNNYY